MVKLHSFFPMSRTGKDNVFWKCLFCGRVVLIKDIQRIDELFNKLGDLSEEEMKEFKEGSCDPWEQEK